MSGTLSGTSFGQRFTATDLDATPADVAPAPEPPPAAAVKVCRACGTDVAGRRRYRDDLGYLCHDCKKAEELRLNQGRVACRVCGKPVLPENLTEYEGTRMCPKCHGERIAMRKQEIQRIGFKGARNRDELRQLYVYLAIGGVLLFFILLGVVINHFRHG